MGDAMEVDAEGAAAPRTWRVVKGKGRISMGKVPPAGACGWLFDSGKGTMVEEVESDVSEDEEDPNAVKVPPWQRKKRGWRGRRREKEHRWRISSGEAGAPPDHLGTREGGQSSQFVALREVAPGVLEAVLVDNWYNFRPKTSHATPDSETVEKAMKNDKVRYDVAEQTKLQPWRQQHRGHRAGSMLPCSP